MVITDDAVVLGHESIAPTGERDQSAEIDGTRLLDDIGRILEYAAALFPAGGGTVIVSRPPGGWAASPYAGADRDLAAMVHDATQAGWSPSRGYERGYESGWFTFSRKSTEIHVGVRPLLDAARTPLWDTADATSSEIAYRLACWHAATGQPFRQTAGVVGCAIVRGYYDGRGTNGFKRAQPLWQMRTLPTGVHTAAGELRWRRSPTDHERTRPMVVSYDMRGARLNALGMVDCLAWGALDNTGPRQFDPQVGGFWQIKVGELLTNGRPLPLFVSVDRPLIPPIVSWAGADADGRAWVTTPVMRWLAARHVRPLVYGSWTAEKSGRWLRGPAEQIRRALHVSAGDDRQTLAVKQLYRQLSGMMTAAGGSIYRPDWTAAGIDHERCSVLSAAERVHNETGLLPLRVNIDELTYAVDPDADSIPAIEAALGVGPQLGKFKVKPDNCGTMADYLAKHGH